MTTLSSAQTVPEDLSIELSSASMILGGPNPPEVITVNANGEVTISEMAAEGGALPAMTYQLEADAVERIYTAVETHDFFTLKSNYVNPAIDDGDYARLEITANGRKHIVRTVNIRLSDFDQIAIAINREMPGDRIVVYNALHIEEYGEAER